MPFYYYLVAANFYYLNLSIRIKKLCFSDNIDYFLAEPGLSNGPEL